MLVGRAELGMIFIYVFVFGMSDWVVKTYIKTDAVYLFYHVCMAMIGVFLIGSS